MPTSSSWCSWKCSSRDPAQRRSGQHDPEQADGLLVRRDRPDELLADGRMEGADRVLARRPGGDDVGEGRVSVLLLGHHDVDLGVEVAEERALGDVGGVGDLLDGGRVVALALEQVEGGADDRVAGLRLLALPAARRLASHVTTVCHYVSTLTNGSRCTDSRSSMTLSAVPPGPRRVRRRRLVRPGSGSSAAVAVIGARPGQRRRPRRRFEIPGVESQQALDVLEDEFPAAAGTSAQLVFAVGSTARSPTRPPRPRSTPPSPTWPASPTSAPSASCSVSADGRVAFADVQYDAAVRGHPRRRLRRARGDAADATTGGVVVVELGGDLPSEAVAAGARRPGDHRPRSSR